MTDEEIKKDQEARTSACDKELGDVLNKYELAIIAEDDITPFTKLKVGIKFVDKKVYKTAALAQPSNSTTGQPTNPSVETAPSVNEGGSLKAGSSGTN